MTFPHDLLGRRFEFVTLTAPDFTVIGYSTANDSCYVHGRTGTKQHLRLSMVVRAIRRGAIQESMQAPFVLGRQEGVTVRS